MDLPRGGYSFFDLLIKYIFGFGKAITKTKIQETKWESDLIVKKCMKQKPLIEDFPSLLVPD